MHFDNITLVTIIGLPEYAYQTSFALKKCLSQASFKDVKIISCTEMPNCDIPIIKIPNTTRESYSEFLVHGLKDYIDTEFCLTFQQDGFIIDTQYWTDEFLNYDYIGAPWLISEFDLQNIKQNKPFNLVGNGGFSLRSKKYLQDASTIKYNPKVKFQANLSAGELATPEDWFICSHSYAKTLELGIKYPSVKLAYRFSVEHPSVIKPFDRNNLETYQSFGFHGPFNIAGMKTLEKELK
jgi:hypothetical protein